jgi:hypothetical protein
LKKPLFLIFCLFLSSSALPTGQVLFLDDFSDNQNGWDIQQAASWSAFIEAGKYKLKNTSDDEAFVSWNDSIQIPEGRDFSLEAHIAKTAGPDDRGYGLVWGVLDANNLYRFEVSGDGHFAIFQNNRGILSPILNWEEAEPANKGNASNTLSIARFGEWTHFYINGEWMAAFLGMPFFAQSAGFINEAGVHTDVDRITLTDGVVPHLYDKMVHPDDPMSQPPLSIQNVSIQPQPVPAGSSFDIAVDFTVRDPYVAENTIPVLFSLTILKNGQPIFAKDLVEIQAFNGRPTRRIENMKASKRAGTYSIKITLKYQDAVKEFTSGLYII